jgi:hypothetical protein
MPQRTRSGQVARWLLLGVVVAALALVGGNLLYHRIRPSDELPPAPAGESEEQFEERVHNFCSACHAYPPADTFPRKHWAEEVQRAYRFFENSSLAIQPPPQKRVIDYYEQRAPKELPLPELTRSRTPYPVRFEKVDYPPPQGVARCQVSNVQLVRLFHPTRPEVLATDMRNGLVMLLKPYEDSPKWQVLGKVNHPAHAEVVDLDGDGVKDVLVADLGSFPPTDRQCGSVAWLRGRPDGTFAPPVTLLKDVGRVADVQAADFRGTGQKDLVVASFGWNYTGEIYFLENKTTDWSAPRFEKKVLDTRHGSIHVPVLDLDGDGKPDFIALIAQEHEVVVAFMNQGGGNFKRKTLFKGPHPGYGSSGIRLVDMNGDGRPDILYTNGDTLDQPYLLKPYHTVQWLENRGPDKPWEHHHLGVMYGVHSAVAADLRGNGTKDVVAVSFLPVEGFPQRKEKDLDAVVVLEQTAPGKYVRHALSTVTCDHVTLAVGEVFGTGRQDLVVGNFSAAHTDSPVTIWKNLGRR